MPTMDLDAFDKALQDSAKEERERATKLIQNFTGAVFNGIREGDPQIGLPGTPHRTGYARANWDLEAGSTRFSQGFNGTGSDNPNLAGNSPIPLTPVEPVLLTMQLGDQARITNPVPYITDLEMGSSGQAPEGMVRLTVAVAPELLEREAKKLGYK
jgi:hypothetical protein